MIRISFFIVFLIVSVHVVAQQVPQVSFFNEAKAFWNPAYTGMDGSRSFNLKYRQQWLGFGSGTPRTVNMDYQHPFTGLNMALGGGLQYDQTGPVKKTGINLNYAYQIKDLGYEGGILNLGIYAGGNNYGYDPKDEIARHEGDPLLIEGNQSGFYPNIGLGVYYLTSQKSYINNTVYYFGASAMQAYQFSVLTSALNQKRIRVVHGDVGAKMYNTYSYIEPYISFSVGAPDALHALVGVKYEMEDLFWGGLGYASSGEIALQAGYIIPELMDNASRLKIGLLGNIPVTDRFTHFGPTAEAYIRWEFDR